MIVQVLGIIAVFFVPAAVIVLIVWFKSNEKRNRQRLQAELYAKALEKGQPIRAVWRNGGGTYGFER